MKKVFLLIMVAFFATLSTTEVSAQKKLKSITINVDSLGLLDGSEIYAEFKDSTGITGVTYSFNNFYTMNTPDSITNQNGSIQFRVVKAPPVKYRAILKQQVQATDEQIAKEQKINSDRISRRQELDAKSKIKD